MRKSLMSLWNEHVLPRKLALIGNHLTNEISAIVNKSLDLYLTPDPFGSALNDNEGIRDAFTKAINAVVLPFSARGLSSTEVRQALAHAAKDFTLQLN